MGVAERVEHTADRAARELLAVERATVEIVAVEERPGLPKDLELVLELGRDGGGGGRALAGAGEGGGRDALQQAGEADGGGGRPLGAAGGQAEHEPRAQHEGEHEEYEDRRGQPAHGAAITW